MRGLQVDILRLWQSGVEAWRHALAALHHPVRADADRVVGVEPQQRAANVQPDAQDHH